MKEKKQTNKTWPERPKPLWSDRWQLSGNFLMIRSDRPAVYLIYFVTVLHEIHLTSPVQLVKSIVHKGKTLGTSTVSTSWNKQICFDFSHPLPLIDVNALICTCYVECEYVFNVAQTVCSWTLTLHKILLFWLLCLENNPARCSLRHVFSSRQSGHRSTLVVTVEMGSVDQRKIRQQGFNCVSSVVLQLLLATLENTGIQSAFRWWRNLPQ